MPFKRAFVAFNWWSGSEIVNLQYCEIAIATLTSSASAVLKMISCLEACSSRRSRSDKLPFRPLTLSLSLLSSSTFSSERLNAVIGYCFLYCRSLEKTAEPDEAMFTSTIFTVDQGNSPMYPVAPRKKIVLSSINADMVEIQCTDLRYKLYEDSREEVVSVNRLICMP